MSDPNDPIELPAFCEDFQTTLKAERTAYVASELRRIDAEGLPVLRTVLSCPDDDAQALATMLLHDNADDAGEEILSPRAWRLRLVKDAVPPPTDPQGRRLPEGRRGKVLVVKVGNKGGRLPEGATATQTDAFSGPRRGITVRAGRDLYELAEVTHAAKPYSLRNAILILRQWGFAVAPDRARVEPDRDNNPVVVQVNWIVEEVLDAREPTSDAAPKKKAA